MAHNKIGLDYFSLDTDIDQDDKISYIISKYGHEGFSITIKLLMKIYKNSYYYNWTNNEKELFILKNNISNEKLDSIVNDLIDRKMFDKRIHDVYMMLTSKGIQKRYLESTVRRKRVDIEESLLLLDNITLGNHTNVHIVNTLCIHDVNIALHDGTKVKEKEKEKEKIVEETTATSFTEKSDDELKCFNDYEFTIYPFYQIHKRYNPNYPLVMGNIPPVDIKSCVDNILLLKQECIKKGVDYIEYLSKKLMQPSWVTKISNAKNTTVRVISSAANYAIDDVKAQQSAPAQNTDFTIGVYKLDTAEKLAIKEGRAILGENGRPIYKEITQNV